MFKVGDRVRVKKYNDKDGIIIHDNVGFTGTIIEISNNTVLIKYDDWGKFWMWKERILSMTILCAGVF